MDDTTFFWMWAESLSRSMGWNEDLQREGHLGNDHGLHHILPGWGVHPVEEPMDVPVGNDLQEAHERGDRPKARIGKEVGRDRDVYFDPDLPEAHLSNAHLTITGESGSGKTQAMKTILADLNAYAVPSLILDFKDDYAEPKYAAKEGFTVYDPTRSPLPFNPLQPPVDPLTGEVNTVFHTYQLVEILARIYSLGEIQQSKLRTAVRQVYDDAGIGKTVGSNVKQWPSFDAVKDALLSMKDTADIVGHMSPMFDFGFFSDPDPAGFAKIASGNTVIRLAQLPGDEVKNSVAEFFLMALYNYLVRLDQTYVLRQVLVLDEAWRVVNSPFLEPLMREARAFGLGVFVATQFPTDLPLVVQGSAGTALYFSQSNPQQVSTIEQVITGSTNSPAAEQVGTIVRGMLPLVAILHNKQYEPFVKVEARPYYARYHESLASRVAQEKVPGDDGRHICSHCQVGTDNADGICDACKSLVGTFVDSSQESIKDRIEQAKVSNASPRLAEMQKFPPGEDDGDEWMFPYSIQERFVESPRRRHARDDHDFQADDNNGDTCRFCGEYIEGHDIDDHEAEVEGNCPACGSSMSYCQGHGEIGDPEGNRILMAHDDGRHEDCHPDGCQYAGESPYDYRICIGCDGKGIAHSRSVGQHLCGVCKGTGLMNNRKSP